MKTFEERMRRKIEGESVILKLWIDALKHEHAAAELEVEGDNTPFNDNLDSAEIVEEQEESSRVTGEAYREGEEARRSSAAHSKGALRHLCRLREVHTQAAARSASSG